MSALAVAIARKSYAGPDGEIVALADLRFAMPAGQFACVVGPSGCGKTTLLSIIAGLEASFDGAITHDGPLPPRLGIMFQTPRLMPWLTVRENVRLALERPQSGDGRAESLLCEMGLERFLDAYPRQLSGGLQQRVALARAFVNDPELLLLDEPFHSLDAPMAQALRELLLRLWGRRHVSVLFVTHDLREALSVADRVLFLTASPARVMLDLPIELPRPRAPEGAAVAGLRQRLLTRYPEILRGVAAEIMPDGRARA